MIFPFEYSGSAQMMILHSGSARNLMGSSQRSCFRWDFKVLFRTIQQSTKVFKKKKKYWSYDICRRRRLWTAPNKKTEENILKWEFKLCIWIILAYFWNLDFIQHHDTHPCISPQIRTKWDSFLTQNKNLLPVSFSCLLFALVAVLHCARVPYQNWPWARSSRVKPAISPSYDQKDIRAKAIQSLVYLATFGHFLHNLKR